MEKLLPQNIEAESGVLGSIIIDPEAIIQVADFLHADDFYRDAHRTIYEVITQLYEQSQPADFITICDELERRNKLEDVGGPSYITSLINQVPTSGNVEYYGRIVERNAILRRLIHAAGQIAATAYEEIDANEALDRAEQLIFAISQRHARADFSALRDLLSSYMEKLDQLHERRGSIVGVPSGFTDLDRLTGGLQRSDLIILAARPAMGKCLTARTRIDNPETGERLTIEEYVQRRLPSVYGVSEAGKVRQTRITDWVDSGIQPCYRVKTKSGRMVEVTGHHPFLTVHGWTPLHDLTIGQYIAVPTAVPAFGTDESWSLDTVRLLAYFIAEDTVTGKFAQDTFFPTYVWTWSRRHLAEFLHTLLTCHGRTYASPERSAIEFTSASPQLATDVHHALIRFGITARLFQPSPDAWSVEVTTPESLQRYREEIEHGVFTPIVSWNDLTTRRGGGGSRGEAWTLAVAQSLRHDYHMEHVSNIRHDGQWHDGRPQGSTPHDTTAPAPTGTSSEVYWDELVAIEPIGEHQVYDLTVPDGANFVAQDIFVHNTSLALSLAHNAAVKYQQSVAVFSLEMSKEQLVQRILSMDAGVDQQRLRTGWIEDDEWERLIYSMGTLSEANIWIEDTAGISTIEMRSKARRLQAEHGVDLIIIDYLQLMQSNVGGVRNKNREQEISEISRSLKGLARELNVPVLALAQLSRAVESRSSKVPQLSDLRESGCLAGETPVYLPDSNSYHPIAELIGKCGFRVLALNTETGQLEPRLVTHAFATGRKPVYKMTTRVGKTIRATANHKFLTLQGWKRLDTLAQDERIALPKVAKGNMYWDEIISREPDGEEEVYDLTVDTLHNFVAGDIIVHNSIEQDADIVMFIYRDDVYNPESERKNIADIIIAKHRNGPVGEVSLYFQASQTRFRDLEATPPVE